MIILNLLKVSDLDLHFEKISTYRGGLMGIATIMIIMCHAASWCTGLPSLVRSILLLGNLGVDLFLFLSGVGLFFSWGSLPSTQVQGLNPRIKWLFRRYVRLLVPYLLISIPFYVLLGCLKDDSLSTIVSNIFTVSYWTRHEGAWYVAMLIPLYLVTPFLFKLFSGRWKWIWFFLLTFCCLVNVFIRFDTHSFLQNVQFVISRLPCFFLGICIAPCVKGTKIVSISPFVFCLVLMALLSLAYIAYKSGTVFAVFVVPCLVFMFCILFDVISQSFYDVMSLLGSVSLESYLLNIYLPRFFNEFQFPILKESPFYMYLATIVLGIAGALFFGGLNKKLVVRINQSFSL